MVTYNHERYIAQAIESVLMQQTTFDYEIVIGEDDSSDNTRAIVKEYKERFPDRIRLFLNSRNDVIYIHGAPTGLWNIVNCLNNVRGKYIALLEGDDYWTSPSKLQKQVDILEKDQSLGGCFHETQLVYEDGSLGKVYGRDANDLMYPDDTITAYSPFHTSSLVFRNDALQFPDWLFETQSADMALFSIVSAFGPLQKIPEIMSIYRKHKGGVTNRPDVVANFCNNRISLIERLNNFHGHKYDKKAKEVISQILKLHK
jgi:glycosyltransferase involved in cell wall biosynthesis